MGRCEGGVDVVRFWCWLFLFACDRLARSGGICHGHGHVFVLGATFRFSHGQSVLGNGNFLGLVRLWFFWSARLGYAAQVEFTLIVGYWSCRIT